jgi:hypothetical protein
LVLPATEANRRKLWLDVIVKEEKLGVTDTPDVAGGVIVMMALADFVESAMLLAVTVTVVVEETDDGAV